MCEPVAFGGVFLGVADPSADLLRVPIGKGLTGWVAAHATPVRVADARFDPRRLVVGPDEEPESMLLAPMTYEDVVRGVLVVSKKGIDRYAADDLTTLSDLRRLRRPGARERGEPRPAAQPAGRSWSGGWPASAPSSTSTRRSSPRATRTPVLERDRRCRSAALSGTTTCTIYRLDRDRGVRVAVLARDRYAEVILAEQIPVGSGPDRLGRGPGRGGPRQRRAPGSAGRPRSRARPPSRSRSSSSRSGSAAK